MTPEGKVKQAISAVLRNYDSAIYWFMPVQTGYGAATLDYIGWVRGVGFAIEAKARGGRPTARQRATIKRMQEAGAQVFVIDGPEGLVELTAWLHHVVSREEDAVTKATYEVLKAAQQVCLAEYDIAQGALDSISLLRRALEAREKHK